MHEYYTSHTMSPTHGQTNLFGQRPNKRIPGPFRAKNRYILTSSQKRTQRALPLVKGHCTCFWPDKPQVHPSFVYSAWLSTVFCNFLANQMPSIVLLYAAHTNANVRGDLLHPSHPIVRHTNNTRMCLHTSAEIHTYRSYDIRIPISTMATDGSALAAPKSR